MIVSVSPVKKKKCTNVSSGLVPGWERRLASPALGPTLDSSSSISSSMGTMCRALSDSHTSTPAHSSTPPCASTPVIAAPLALPGYSTDSSQGSHIINSKSTTMAGTRAAVDNTVATQASRNTEEVSIYLNLNKANILYNFRWVLALSLRKSATTLCRTVYIPQLANVLALTKRRERSASHTLQIFLCQRTDQTQRPSGPLWSSLGISATLRRWRIPGTLTQRARRLTYYNGSGSKLLVNIWRVRMTCTKFAIS